MERSSEVTVTVDDFLQKDHIDDDESSDVNEGDIGAATQLHLDIDVVLELPFEDPARSEHEERSVDYDGVVVEGGKSSVSAEEESPTLDREAEPTVSHHQSLYNSADAHHRSQQPETASTALDASPGSTDGVLSLQVSRCGLELLPWGFTLRREQILLASTFLSVSLALGVCALYFRDAVDDATGVNAGLVFGSAGSLAVCSVVIGAFVRSKRYRRHMHTLLANLALCDFLLALSFALEPVWHRLRDGTNEELICRWLSTVREYFIMCSSVWTVCTALDLLRLMTNPFVSPRSSRRAYQLLAHGAAAASALVMALSDSFAAPVTVGDFCWIGTHPRESAVSDASAPSESGTSESSSSNSSSSSSTTEVWLFVVAPAVVTLGGCSYVAAVAWTHSRGSASASHPARQALLIESFLAAATLALYSALLWGVFGGLWVASAASVASSSGRERRELLVHAFAFLLSFRGGVPFALWCLYSRSPAASEAPRVKAEFWPSQRTGVLAAPAGEDDEDENARPPMTRALLAEFVQLATQGIAAAVRSSTAAAGDADDADGADVDAPSAFALQPATCTSAACAFSALRPAAFRRAREAFGVDDTAFLRSLAACTAPAASEGASGAIMIFSADRRFLVKSLSARDCSVLLALLDRYLAHVLAYRESRLARFLGCYCLELHGRRFYLSVMENVLAVPPASVVRQRFDIKGSWVDRRAKQPRRGAEVSCRHCGGVFLAGVDGGRSACPSRVGASHEPDVVLKDLDLTAKLQLGPGRGRLLLRQLERDSDFLCDQGITDYSLLVGVVEGGSPGDRRDVLLSDGVARYYCIVGIVDVLQTWSAAKRAERFVKTTLLRRNPDGISAMAPRAYRDRFHRRLREIICLDDERADAPDVGVLEDQDQHGHEGGDTRAAVAAAKPLAEESRGPAGSSDEA